MVSCHNRYTTGYPGPVITLGSIQGGWMPIRARP